MFRKAEENGAMLTAWILQRYGWGIDRVKQHADFARKNCPGKTRELGWSRFLGMVQKYLNDGKPNNSTTKPQVPVQGKVICGTLNVRPLPNTTRKQIGQIKLNNIVDITGRADNGWYQIDFDGKVGYVSNQYISVIKYGNEYAKVNKATPTNKRNEIVNKNSRFYQIGDLNIIETTPDNIEIVQMYGKTMRQSGKSGINGTFFDTPRPAKTASTWQIAINDKKPIGENSFTNSYKGIKRATMSYYSKGKLYNQYINNTNDYKEMPIWAIGGVGLIPTYNPTYEKVPKDILRRTYHTALAYKDNKVFLITSNSECYLNSFKTEIEKAISPVSCINLDGGGSTQMTYNGKSMDTRTRPLNNAVVLKEI